MFSALYVRTVNSTALIFNSSVPSPVPTLRATHVQDKIAYDETRGTFVLFFDLHLKIESVTTTLQFPKKELIKAFDCYKRRK
jgi:hypothetical protein